MLVNFVSESDAERIYGDRCVIVDDSYSENELQDILDEWLIALPDELKDQFGAIDYKNGVTTLDKLVELLPAQLHARISDVKQYELFI